MSEPDWVLDAMEKHRPGWGLAGRFYWDQAWFARELREIFLPSWHFVCHTSELPNEGSYVTFQLGTEPLLVVRGEGGQIHAMINACRHRGSKMCMEEAGTIRRLVCPYHQWVYEWDGSLTHARQMPADFDRTGMGLHRAAVAEHHGFVFVNLGSDPEPFSKPCDRWLEPYELRSAKAAGRARVLVKANWKVVLENFVECYHCGGVHPEYCRAMAGAAGSYQSAKDAEREAGRTEQELSARLEELGVDGDRPRFAFREGVATQSLDGKAVAPLLGRQRDFDGTVMAVWMGDSCEIEVNPDHAVAFRFTPLDVRTTEVVISWLVRGDAKEGVDYSPERLTEFWKITGDQDWSICEAVQTGVESHYYQPGPLSESEGGPKYFIDRYLARWNGGSKI